MSLLETTGLTLHAGTATLVVQEFEVLVRDSRAR